MGASLAFFPITPQEFETLAGETDELSPRKIGGALKQLNAFGQENAVTTAVLATTLAPAIEGETEERKQGRVQSLARALAPLSKSKLEAYCHRDGRELRWCLPSPA